MKKIAAVFSFLISFTAACYAQEQITITTYYPAPVGVYTELRAKRMAIGDAWFNPATNIWGTQIGANADLVVEGRVGIGTRDPSEIAHITGGNLLVNNNAAGTTSSGLRFVSNIGNTHYNWKIGAQSLVDGGLEFTPSTAVDGTTFSSPALLLTRTGRVGIATSAPNVVLDMRSGDTNLCLRVQYDVNTTTRNCPVNYYMMYPRGTVAAAPPSYFICCRGCIDAAGDGACDFADNNDNEVAD